MFTAFASDTVLDPAAELKVEAVAVLLSDAVPPPAA